MDAKSKQRDLDKDTNGHWLERQNGLGWLFPKPFVFG